MTDVTPFRPDAAATVNLAVTTTTGRVQVLASARRRNFRIFNAGSVTVFVELGGSTVAAVATTAIPVAGGASLVLNNSGSNTYVAAITASSTATLYVTPGLDGL